MIPLIYLAMIERSYKGQPELQTKYPSLCVETRSWESSLAATLEPEGIMISIVCIGGVET